MSCATADFSRLRAETRDHRGAERELLFRSARAAMTPRPNLPESTWPRLDRPRRRRDRWFSPHSICLTAVSSSVSKQASMVGSGLFWGSVKPSWPARLWPQTKTSPPGAHSSSCAPSGHGVASSPCSSVTNCGSMSVRPARSSSASTWIPVEPAPERPRLGPRGPRSRRPPCPRSSRRGPANAPRLLDRREDAARLRVALAELARVVRAARRATPLFNILVDVELGLQLFRVGRRLGHRPPDRQQPLDLALLVPPVSRSLASK